MTTALAVTGHDLMLAPTDRHTPRAHVFPAPGEQPFEAALAETQAVLAQHGHLVVLHPATLPLAHRHRLHAVRSLLESDRIALLPVALPPVGVAVLARQLRRLSVCDLGPGVLASAARLLAHYVHAGAVLASVARLEHVPVSLTAHAGSWVPGSRFAVLAAPAPHLMRLGGDGAGSALPGPDYPTRLTLARGGLTTDWITGSLAPHWRVTEIEEVRLPAAAPSWWGTGKLTEFAAAIADPDVLERLVRSVRRDTCHWCGLQILGDRCPFCAAPVPAAPQSTAPPADAPSTTGNTAASAAGPGTAVVHQGVHRR
ncbi:MAG TPA: hypothetical protein VFH77_03850 [Streptomyces sp.]|nr:hypothetical protein [Streptomyces sp.]